MCWWRGPIFSVLRIREKLSKVYEYSKVKGNMDQQLIRNFCIIAHIDHGKSTLADRILEFGGLVEKRLFRDQLLDDMDLERERGITIKSSAVTLPYRTKDKTTYLLNLIDTPGHVDFNFEVAKTLRACEGAILLVDASQGVEAQTVANLTQALEQDLVILPVINKIDLNSAEPERTAAQIHEILKVQTEILRVSAKERIGIEELLEEVCQKVPPPKGERSGPLQALIFDSTFDIYKGVIVAVRVIEGAVRPGMKIQMMATKRFYEVQEVGIFQLKMVSKGDLSCGEVGYLTANIKEVREIKIGDTVTDFQRPAGRPLPGYREIRPMVFSGIYPVNPKDFPSLRSAIDKLHLNDSSFVYEPENSAALGPGFRCGFLGLLHMEIIHERLEREYGLNLLLTTPSVVYEAAGRDGQLFKIDNPSCFPSTNTIQEIREPMIRAIILTPQRSLGEIMTLVTERRGKFVSSEYLDEDKVKLVFELPLSEVIVDFYDRLKSITRGYGSLDYTFKEYVPSEIVKLDILLNGELCEAFSILCHRTQAFSKGKALVQRLRELIPRHQFKVQIQAAIGSRVIAAESISAMKKAVTAKCYGGDITRKRKLWEKQKVGKKRMKQFGRVEIPQAAFLEALKAR